MAMTAAERQKEYREKRPFAGDDGNGERRVSAYVSTKAALALHRLADIHGITKREILERLLLAEDERVLRELDLDSPERKKYLGEPG